MYLANTRSITASKLNFSSFRQSKMSNDIFKIKFLTVVFFMKRIERADYQSAFMVERKHDIIILSFEKLLSQLAIETPMVR